VVVECFIDKEKNMLYGLLDDDFNLFGGGIANSLLTPDQASQLKNQALKTAGLTTALSYLAQPKNRNVGSVIPYAAQAGLQGFGAGQNMYNMGLGSVLRNKTLQAALGSKIDPFSKVDLKDIDRSRTTPEDISYARTTGDISKLKFKDQIKNLYQTSPTELADGSQVFLPTPEGMAQGKVPLTTSNQPYTKEIKVKPKALTADQSDSLGFASKMQLANNSFENLVKEDGSLSYSPARTNFKGVVEKVWVVGDAGAAALNKLNLSDEDKLAVQSQRNFINSVLRKESGAAIAAHEFTNAQRQYFPEVGDTPPVLKQKADNRKIAIATMQAAAGQDPEAMDKLNALQTQLTTKVEDSPSTAKEVEQQTAQSQTAYIGNRKIIVKDNQWVFADTGESVN